MEWHHQITEQTPLSKEVSVSYVTFGYDTDVLLFYLEKAKAYLSHLKHDAEGIVKKQPFLQKDPTKFTYVFLVDTRNDYVMAFGNPFEGENVMKVYKQYGLFGQ